MKEVPGPGVRENPKENLVERARELIGERGVFHRKAERSEREFSYVGYPDGRLYGWDSYFEGVLHYYLDLPLEYGLGALELFLDAQERDGYIPRTLPRVWWGQFHQQPFLAQLALLLFRRSGGDWKLNPERYFQLKSYLMYWKRRMSRRRAGLSAWDHAGQTGMDNHFERAGHFHDFFCEGVDLNCYLVREWKALAILAQVHGFHLERETGERESERLSAAIQTWCWNPEERTFLDFHAEEERTIEVYYAGMFLPLWAGVATQEQADILVERHLTNPKAFATPYPIPVISRQDPGYLQGWHPDEFLDCCSWRAHVWMPLNWMITEGLFRYGYKELAQEIRTKSLRMFEAHPFAEYYKAESGEPMGRQNFTGWSSLALFPEWKENGPGALTPHPLG